MTWLTDEFVAATIENKHEEARRARLVSEARRQAREGENRRAWRWRVEPGMEEPFRALLPWLLSSQQDVAVEIASPAQQRDSLSDLCPPLCCRGAA